MDYLRDKDLHTNLCRRICHDINSAILHFKIFLYRLFRDFLPRHLIPDPALIKGLFEMWSNMVQQYDITIFQKTA